MRIAQIAPLMEAVPPLLYGGTERIASYLTEELVRQGHDVTLFASGDSQTSAKLVACCEGALRLNPGNNDPLPYQMMQLEAVRRRAASFDVLHFHTDLLHFPLLRGFDVPAVTTLHGRLDLPALQPLYRVFDKVGVVSISHSQRLPLPGANWYGNVYHGLPVDLLPFTPNARGYLAFLGRISPEKRPDLAIAIALRAGLPLRIAAKVDRVDRDYFETRIRPLLDQPGIEFIGEIGEHEKANFLGGAIALVFPIDWPEPFGLVMIEAMACGTPVVAYGGGSVLEVIDQGLTGVVVSDIDDAAAGVKKAAGFDRSLVRARFEQRFTAARMAADYLAIYRAAVTDLEPEPRSRDLVASAA
jgi:glycosyltransferase involved in cell wall biosynthesis